VRLLLDESLPRLLARALPNHEVSTVQQEGWAGLTNGDLLGRAAARGFDAFLTPDRGFEYQQNPSTLPLTVVILASRSNRLEDLEPLMRPVLDRLETAESGQLLKVAL